PFLITQPKQHSLPKGRMDRVSSVKKNLKGLQAKSSPKQCVNQRWRRYWVTRPKNGETYANRISYSQIFRGKRPIGRVDVIRVGMDGTECAITGGSTVDSYR